MSNSLNERKKIIDEAYNQINEASFTADTLECIRQVIADLDSGKIRVAERVNEVWITNEWVKKAILLFFRTQKMSIMKAEDFSYLDKIPVKQWTGNEGVRVTPHAIARYGSFISSGAILMPSYVNIGAYVGTGTLIDTWATVGSCAQVGCHVHVSGGVGLGGVLEPMQASPVIIEDHAFLGSRCIIVEGAIVEEGAVLGAGVTITSSTKIIDVSGEQPVTHTGRVPKNSVVIPGSYQKNFPSGNYGVPCALIIGKRKASTDRKTSLNDVLREFSVAV